MTVIVNEFIFYVDVSLVYFEELCYIMNRYIYFLVELEFVMLSFYVMRS